MSEFSPQQRPAPRPVLSALVGLLVPGGGLLANGSLWWGSGLVILAALAARLSGDVVAAVVLIGVGSIGAGIQAYVRSDTAPALPGAGAVLLVGVVPGALFVVVLGGVGGLAGLGQFANRTYARGVVFFAAQFALARWSAVAGAHWLPLLAVPLLSIAEAVWSAWLETPST